MKKYRTCDECGRPFSGKPFSDGGSGWRYLFHVDSNSVDGSLEIDVTSRGQVRVGTLARLVDVYLTLCPACLAMVLEVVLQQIKKQAAAEGLLDLSPQPCECIDREECCAGSVAAEITGADAKLPDLVQGIADRAESIRQRLDLGSPPLTPNDLRMLRDIAVNIIEVCQYIVKGGGV